MSAPRDAMAGESSAGRVAVSHNTVHVNGIRMHYVSAGSGEPVLLIHGFPETSYAWRKIIPALSAHFHVIAPDLRGCGESDRPRGTYDKRVVAEDLHQLVALLEFGAVNLVGHDVGTMVSYAYAVAYPAEIRRLVLMEAALPGLGLEELYDASKFPQMWHLGLFEAPNGLAEALIAGREKLFVEHFMLQQTYDPSGLDEGALEEYARRLAAPGALRGGIEYFRSHAADAERNIESAKTKLPMPVLTVSAKASFKDVLGPPLQAAAKNVQSLEVEQCGHYVAEERPDWLIDQLLRFFSQAEHLDVLISGVFLSAYDELLPSFEKTSGVIVNSYLSPSMGQSSDSVSSRLERGEPADVLIMAESGLDHVVSEGLAQENTRVELASAPVGIAVKAGSPKPDISSAEKLREVLLTANSVAYSISASGKYVSGELFKKLGIEDQMKGKAHEVEGTTPVAKTVADGTYEIGFQSLSELGAVDGVELVGALPDPVGRSTLVAGAVASNSRSPHEAAALLRFLSRSELTPILRKHGLDPPVK